MLQAALGLAQLMPMIGRNFIAKERAYLLQNRATRLSSAEVSPMLAWVYM